MATLRMERPEAVPRATEHIPEMVALIERLIARGHTYTADGSVYFRIATFPEYGRLSRLDVPGIKAGARVDTDKYEKENARDFVLWKAKSDEPAWAQWDAPFGRGRPGWHIECSAMSMKYLGETFDLHCGGVDLDLPAPRERDRPERVRHRASPSCGTGCTSSTCWSTTRRCRRARATSSRSPTCWRGATGRTPSATCSRGAHYRKQLNFTFEGLQHAKAALERIHGLVTRLGEVDGDGPGGRGGRRPARARGPSSTRRSATTSTRPRRWPPSTTW